MDSTFRVHKVDSANREKFVLKTVEKVNELTELNTLKDSIIVSQDTTIQKQKEIIAIADTLHSNNSLIIQDLKDTNKSLRKKLFKEKVKVRLVAIGGVALVVIAIIAL
jgi:translation initiation factor IF-2